jgi:hypothetical protein
MERDCGVFGYWVGVRIPIRRCVLIYKMVTETTKPEERHSGKHYNDFPLNMREISPAQFWNWYGTYTPVAQEFRQPQYDRNEDMTYGGHWGNLMMFYTDYDYTEGYAFTTQWDHTRTTSGYKAPNDFWPRFFKFGPCIHHYVEKKIDKCLHRHTCTKCGKSYEIDSSD